jgi:PHD/YefM family antitoxin component YafN of YafNO toxin-antitoxin module
VDYALDGDYVDPVAFGPKQLVSSTKLVRNLSSYIEQSKKRPVFIMRDQEVEAVLVNIDVYRDLLEEEAKVEDLYHAVMTIRRLIEHLKSGEEALGFDDVLNEFGLTRDSLTEVETISNEMDS